MREGLASAVTIPIGDSMKYIIAMIAALFTAQVALAADTKKDEKKAEAKKDDKKNEAKKDDKKA